MHFVGMKDSKGLKAEITLRHTELPLIREVYSKQEVVKKEKG